MRLISVLLPGLCIIEQETQVQTLIVDLERPLSMAMQVWDFPLHTITSASSSSVNRDQQRPLPCSHRRFPMMGTRIANNNRAHLPESVMLAFVCPTNRDYAFLAHNPLHLSSSVPMSTQPTQPTSWLALTRFGSVQLTQFNPIFLYVFRLFSIIWNSLY